MASIHNVMIRSFNSIIYHAPSVTPEEVPSFMKYCRAVVSTNSFNAFARTILTNTDRLGWYTSIIIRKKKSRFLICKENICMRHVNVTHSFDQRI